MKRNLLKALVASLFAVPAFAAQETTTFQVSAEVSVACTISASNLGFSSFNVLSGSNVDATSTLTAKCTNGSGYTVGLNEGTGAGATVGARKMTHATDSSATLNYGLYLNAGRSTNWDDVGGTNVHTGTGSGVNQTITVYGRVPSGQTSPIVGTYSDTITVKIDF